MLTSSRRSRFLPLVALFASASIYVGTTQCQAQSEQPVQGPFNRLPFRSVESDSNIRVASLGPSAQLQETGNKPIRSNLYPPTSSSSFDPTRSNTFTPKQDPVGAGETPSRTTSPRVVEEPESVGSKTEVKVNFASILLIDDILLPALEPGPIKEILVKEGDYIPAGTVVGRINDDLLLLEFEQQRLRYDNERQKAVDTISRQAAAKEYALQQSKYSRTQSLALKGSATPAERDQARFEAEIAQLKVSKAESDQKLAEGLALLELSRLEIVKNRISRHVMKSEFEAYVIEILKKQQEYVPAGEPVMRLGRMDELWAQGNVDVKLLDEHNALNRPVTVTLKMANGRKETFEGRVDQIPLERQGSTSYAVKVRIKNRRADEQGSWLLRPLAQVEMVIHLDRGLVADMPSASPARASAAPATGSSSDGGFAPLPAGKR